MTKLAFICQRGLESFIDPIAQQFEKLTNEYQTHRYYVNCQQDIVAAVKWADIVWLEWANEISIFATSIFDMRKKGVIMRLHSYEALSNMPEQIDFSVVDYLVFVAPHIKEILKERIPDIEKKVYCKIIPNGVDIDNIQLNKNLSLYDISYVANINHKKEPALALQIMAELGTDYRLHIAGTMQDERYRIYMKHMAKEMGIADNIIYYGFVQDMATWWEGKGIILSTSIHEGHPMNIIEGAARGLRPVIHNFYGAKEMYPENWYYNTTREPVSIITSPMDCKNGDLVLIDKTWLNSRDYIIKKGWTTENQMKQIKKLVEKAGSK